MDGNSNEEALTISNTEIKILKNSKIDKIHLS